MSSEALNQRFVYIPKTALIGSLIFHLTLLLAFVTVKVLDHFGIHLFKPHPLEIYQNYIQVDVVGLPDQLINEKKSVDPTLPTVDKPKAVPEPAPKDVVKPEEPLKSADDIMAEKKKAELKKKEEAKRVADEKEKKERDKALKKLQDEAKREAALKALARNGKTGRNKLAGNMLSKGTGASGAIGTASDAYKALIYQRIKEHFNVYAWQRKKGLVSVVNFEILSNGRVRQKKVIKSSVDPLYNSAVLQAIDEAQPFPLPEDKSILNSGITIEFKPE
jgi:colicin import membrane protein